MPRSIGSTLPRHALVRLGFGFGFGFGLGSGLGLGLGFGLGFGFGFGLAVSEHASTRSIRQSDSPVYWRGEAFEAARYAVEALKHRVAIWKHERYSDGSSAHLEGCSLVSHHEAEEQGHGA